MITLIPSGGLCNRMRAITAGMALAEDADAPLRVVWLRDSGMGAAFKDVFTPIDGVEFTDLPPRSEPWTWLRTQLLFPTSLPIAAPLLRAWRRMRFDLVMTESELDTDTLDQADATQFARKRCLLSAWARFYAPTPRSFNAFTPVPSILERVEDVTSRFDSHTVGVHIRRTDHAIAIASSPTERFVRTMEEVVETNPKTRFFLATDSEATETALSEHFKDRLIVREKIWERESAAGVVDATVDLYALSRTSCVIGSYHSSFSHTAAEIGGIPEHTVYATPQNG